LVVPKSIPIILLITLYVDFYVIVSISRSVKVNLYASGKVMTGCQKDFNYNGIPSISLRAGLSAVSAKKNSRDAAPISNACEWQSAKLKSEKVNESRNQRESEE
jgi:hypothetical protein